MTTESPVSDRAALIAAIAANPDDDLLRLVFADWLDEHGEADRAEFIRLQIAAHREFEQLSPVVDHTKLARICDLFLTNYQKWLRPVYEAVCERLPEFEVPTPPPERGVGAFGQYTRHLVGPIGPNTSRPPQGVVNFEPWGVFVGDWDSSLRHISFRRGLLEEVHLDPHRLPPGATFGTAFAAEPMTEIRVTMPSRPGVWEWIEGPHLRRVQSLRLFFDDLTRTHPTPTEVWQSPHWDVLQSVHLRCGYRYAGTDAATTFTELRQSPLRRQLIDLELLGIHEMNEFLADNEHGFDSLRMLSVTSVDPLTDEYPFGGRVADCFRRQTERLRIFAKLTDLNWLTAGPPWERLTNLKLDSIRLEADVVELASTDTLPALRKLRISAINLTPDLLRVLARSPLIRQLDKLELDGINLCPESTRALSEALDGGLKFLSVSNAQEENRRADLIARHGRRVVFGLYDYAPGGSFRATPHP